jgi:hypothetical protein
VCPAPPMTLLVCDCGSDLLRISVAAVFMEIEALQFTFLGNAQGAGCNLTRYIRIMATMKTPMPMAPLPIT